MDAKKLSLPDVLEFDWDEANVNKNREKHKVEPLESEAVFYDEPIFFYDEGHSQTEERYLAYGKTHEKRLLTAVFTIRSNKIRVISARDQHRKERETYKKLGGEIYG